MTRTTPRRRITLHFEQTLFTDARTFMARPFRRPLNPEFASILQLAALLARRRLGAPAGRYFNR